ncbi:MAG TPA: hypothetical protein VK530_02835 [Candidatus Acidoferrum sp.]|nr:hypothetical protein [Candidatus Acidoferrum sp.]
MNVRCIKLAICFSAFLVAAVHSQSQVVRIDFTSEVTNVVGSDLAGVMLGSIITGRVEVELPLLPVDSDEHPGIGQYSYVEQNRPGYRFQFGTGFQSIVFDSTNAATDGGLATGIFMYDEVGFHDHLGIQVRNHGTHYGTILSFEDITEPRTLLSNDYFPEAVNLDPGMARAMFQYFDNFGTNSVVARVTSASITIDTEGVVTGLLLYRVNISGLPAKPKRKLTATLNAAERAFSAGRCRLAVNRLKRFRNEVRLRVVKKDPVLAEVLRSGAQVIIDAGCVQ